MYKFNIVITELCNAYCTHCYMNASNRYNKTLSKDQIDYLINSLPINTDTIVITGGEVYVQKELLYYTLKKINETFDNIVVGVESNGKYFYENEENIEREFKILSDLGVSFIRFSDDVFHAQGGIDLEKVRSLKQYDGYNDIHIKFLKQQDALPIGRAENLDLKFQGKRECMNNKNTYNNPYLFIDINGDVYPCAWKCSPSLGNIFTSDFKDIQDNLYSGFFLDLLVGDIDKIIDNDSNAIKYQKIKKKKGTCMSCAAFFKDLNKL